MTELERFDPQTGLVHRDLRNPQTDGWTDVLEQVADLANKIARTDFVPDGFRGNVAATAAAVLYGREVGLGPMQALASLHSIKGRVAMSAEAMRAKALEAGHDLTIVDSSSAKCTVKGRRRGGEEWTTITWTIDDAKRAGLRGDNWAHYPRQMLQARATAELCRLIFPDAIHGLPAVEELEQEGTAVLQPALTSTRVQRRRAEPPPPPLEAAVSPPTPPAAPTIDQPEIVDEQHTQPPADGGYDDAEGDLDAQRPADPISQGPARDEAPHAASSKAGEATSGDAASPATPDPATRTQLNKLRALLIAHSGTLSSHVVPIIGHPIHAASALTQPEAELVIGELQAQLDRARERPDRPDVDDDGAIPDPDA